MTEKQDLVNIAIERELWFKIKMFILNHMKKTGQSLKINDVTAAAIEDYLKQK